MPSAWFPEVDGEVFTGLLRGFVLLWSFALGASVGSFLNVVVYRLPAGMNLSRPKSRCPRCGTPIRATDNLPVLGWLRLRGRCRACGLPIAARYPLVEAVCGLALAILALQCVLLGGENLPIGLRPAGSRAGDGWAFARSLDAELIVLCGADFVGFAVLLGCGLIALDGHRIPWRLAAFGLAAAVAAAAVWLGLRVWGAEVLPRDVWRGWTLTGPFDAVRVGPLGFAPNVWGPGEAATAAVGCGVCALLLTPLIRDGRGRLNFVLVAAVAGAWWGWWGGGRLLVAGGLAFCAAPVWYAAGAWRGRVPAATVAAFAAAAVPLVRGWQPPEVPHWRPAAWLAAAGVTVWAVGLTIDRLFFAAAADPPAGPVPPGAGGG